MRRAAAAFLVNVARQASGDADLRIQLGCGLVENVHQERDEVRPAEARKGPADEGAVCSACWRGGDMCPLLPCHALMTRAPLPPSPQAALWHRLLAVAHLLHADEDRDVSSVLASMSLEAQLAQAHGRAQPVAQAIAAHIRR